MITSFRHVILLLTLGALTSLLLTAITIHLEQKQRLTSLKSNSKEIVAYSLSKRVELDSEEITCGPEMKFKDNNYEEVEEETTEGKVNT